MDKVNTCRNVVLTGGNSGVGYETIKYLFANGYNVIFGARNVQKNYEAIKTILEETKSEGQTTNWIKSFPLDLSKRQSIL
jgi:NAD(P)-dependent dehydrogenase (short-subunit alcohol dehydrogenase family)